MVCNARASQRASPMLAISPPSHLRRWLGSLENRLSRQRTPLPLASTDITLPPPRTTATSPLDSNPRDRYHPLRASPTHQSLRPRGQTTTAAMSQFVGQVHTTAHHLLQTHPSNPPPSRPASPTPAHGTTSTPASTPGPSAAWPPPSP